MNLNVKAYMHILKFIELNRYSIPPPYLMRPFPNGTRSPSPNFLVLCFPPPPPPHPLGFVATQVDELERISVSDLDPNRRIRFWASWIRIRNFFVRNRIRILIRAHQEKI